MRIASITIARGGSRRLPGKNLLPFGGLPLVAHKARQLRACPSIGEVVVGSDDEDILAAARAEGATVVVRAPEFCDEVTRSWNDVIADMASRVDADVIVWAHCTNPCITPQTYERAIATFRSLDPLSLGDSLVGVSPVRNHFWWRGRPLNFDPYCNGADAAHRHAVAADVKPLLYQNGGLFIARRADMLRWRYVFGPKAWPFLIDAEEATDIDTAEDFRRAQEVHARMHPRAAEVAG